MSPAPPGCCVHGELAHAQLVLQNGHWRSDAIGRDGSSPSLSWSSRVIGHDLHSSPDSLRPVSGISKNCQPQPSHHSPIHKKKQYGNTKNWSSDSKEEPHMQRAGAKLLKVHTEEGAHK